MSMTPGHHDVIIVGAGLSGIGAGVHLQQHCPGKSWLILEGRASLGGTWDLFRYPGVRSDSDMQTLGFGFKPWHSPKAMASGPEILSYLEEAAAEYGVDAHIRYRHRVRRAAWSSAEALWRIDVEREDSGETLRFSCRFLMVCAGYYSYRQGHTPEIEGIDCFKGTVVHPQQWPERLDYRGRTVVVIGSGATAITLVPAMAQDAAHVVMLQRSPSYVLSLPDPDPMSAVLHALLPQRWAHAIARWRNIRFQQFLYRRARSHPSQMRAMLLRRAGKALGPDYDIGTHFSPRYNPWDQRLCFAPNDDLFEAIRSGKASVVTDRIERVTETGIVLASGRTLEADFIVTATGLELVMLGEVSFDVDGAPVDFAQTWTYKGMMYSGVPNLITTFGYINASWTLRADLIADYACRLINHMDQIGAREVVPRLREADNGMPARPWIDHFSSGYMQRMLHRFPKQGDRDPWINRQDYAIERTTIGQSGFDDGALVFGVQSAPVASLVHAMSS